MTTSRRDFLITTAIAGAGVAMDGLTAFAEPISAAASDSARIQAQTVAGANVPVYTRGIGVYPGEPGADFGPILVPDDTAKYRNLALLRPAYHSSSYDYNLTAQLVTDGIKDERLPEWIVVSDVARGPVAKPDREVVVDHAPMNTMEILGTPAQVDIQLAGGDAAPEVDRIQLFVVSPMQSAADSLKFTISTSDDGRTWQEAGSVSAPKPASLAGYPPGFSAPNHFFTPSIPLNSVSRSRFYRVECATASVSGRALAFGVTWKIGQVAFYKGDQRVNVGGPYSFTSAWMSAGFGVEWVYVDLGSRCEFDRVKLYWIARASEGSVQVSDDAENWKDLQSLAGASGQVDDFKLAQPATGRYVRVLMTRPSSPHGYILSEIEVYGRGGFIAKPKPAPLYGADRKLLVAGGSWRLQRSNLVHDAGEALSKPGFEDADWLVATVPGTVLTSYANVGAIPDPNFGQNQLHISDSYFYSDFWYRTEFTAPQKTALQLAWLNFDGINWKADVFLNGEKIGRIEGGFMRGKFDVTDKILPGKVNALAVRIEKNATPGSAKQKTFEACAKNGGALGSDNPTYHSSIGWDWIPTMRGRDIGIWGDVSIAITDAVTIENPFVSTKLPLPDISSADVTIEADLVNHSKRPFSGIVHYHFGELQFRTARKTCRR